MQYLGGKFYSRKDILSTILALTDKRENWVEPFCGAAWMTKVAAEHFRKLYASDLNPDVIMYWQAIQDGWVPPTEVSEELHREARGWTEPSALRAHIMLNCSFGGKWGSGYARGRTINYAEGASRRDTRDAPLLRGVTFKHHGYQDSPVTPDSIVYCDPPYANTAGYKGAGECFNHDEFWMTAQRWANTGADVFVSEYTQPDSDACLTELVWSKTQKVRVKLARNGASRKTATECLFRVLPTIPAVKIARPSIPTTRPLFELPYPE